MLLLPSLMCLDFSKIQTEIAKLESAGVDGYHMDVMDGHFVKTLGLGSQDIAAVRQLSEKPLDIHLMVKNPYEFIDYFEVDNQDIIYFHPEADLEPMKTIYKIKEKGCRAGVVLSAGTAVETISELLADIDAVLVMTVNLGFAGQKFIETVTKKIAKLVNYRNEHNFSFEVIADGALSKERIDCLSKQQVSGFVLGTAALFNQSKSYAKIIEELRGNV